MHPTGDLPEYAAATLPAARAAEVGRHLAGCASCGAEADAWASFAGPVPPPRVGVLLGALRHEPAGRPRWRRPAALARAQARLIPRTVWPVSIAAIVVLALAARTHPVLLPLGVPLIPALGVAGVAGLENGPLRDLVRATATSPRTTLACRLLLVAAVDAAAALLVPGLLATWHGWLGGAALLSALAAVAAVVGGSSVAAGAVTVAWTLRPIAEQAGWGATRSAIQAAWTANPASIAVAVMLVATAVIVVGQGEPSRPGNATTPV